VREFLEPFALHNKHFGNFQEGSMMNYILVLSVLLFTVGQDKLSFEPGQSIHVVATKTNAKIDLAAETKVRSEFEKQKKFKIGNAAANTDFVFLVLTEYDSYSSGVWVGGRKGVVGTPEPQRYLKAAIAILVPSKEYAEHKDDLEKLREISVWQSVSAPSWYKKEVSLSKLVKDFHDQFEKK
jgi:hypothetical protein